MPRILCSLCALTSAHCFLECTIFITSNLNFVEKKPIRIYQMLWNSFCIMYLKFLGFEVLFFWVNIFKVEPFFDNTLIKFANETSLVYKILDSEYKGSLFFNPSINSAESVFWEKYLVTYRYHTTPQVLLQTLLKLNKTLFVPNSLLSSRKKRYYLICIFYEPFSLKDFLSYWLETDSVELTNFRASFLRFLFFTSAANLAQRY